MLGHDSRGAPRAGSQWEYETPRFLHKVTGTLQKCPCSASFPDSCVPRGTGGVQAAEADAALSEVTLILTFSVVIDPVAFRNSSFWAG